MKVKYTKLTPNAILPTKATIWAAAFDIYSSETVYIPPGETCIVGTGIALQIPHWWKGEIYSRSGMASRGIVVANSPGKIDSDYRGEIKVILHNNGNLLAGIDAGTRIAQFEINPVHKIHFEECENLELTERGEGGFGSTGK